MGCLSAISLASLCVYVFIVYSAFIDLSYNVMQKLVFAYFLPKIKVVLRKCEKSSHSM